MRAIICRQAGGPEVMEWAEAPTPTPADHEILIKVAAAGLNRADLLQRQGKYPPPPGASPLMGLEVAGEVVALGPGVTRWKIGDKICALLPGGGYAEYAVAHEDLCLAVPQGFSMIEAAALPESLITVWANVFITGALASHESVLVHGGSSGIGTLAIQMARLHGATVFVTVGSEEKAEACRRLGANLAINYRHEDFVAAVERATDGRGVAMVLDMIGGDYVARNLATLAPFGRHISIATQQGSRAMVDLRLVMQKRLTLTGSTLRGRSVAEKADLVRTAGVRWAAHLAAGELKPLIYRSWPIKNAAEAHKMMESGVHIGKIALEIA